MALIELIRSGQEELEAERLDEAERCFSKALSACRTTEDFQEVLRWLMKLAGKHIRLGVSDQPKTLHEFIEKRDLGERTLVLEGLARLHNQLQDVDGAERIYISIFELRAAALGSDHPDTVGALKTAALFLQTQGKSAEELYVKAHQLNKAFVAANRIKEEDVSPPVVESSAIIAEQSTELDLEEEEEEEEEVDAKQNPVTDANAPADANTIPFTIPNPNVTANDPIANVSPNAPGSPEAIGSLGAIESPAAIESTDAVENPIATENVYANVNPNANQEPAKLSSPESAPQQFSVEAEILNARKRTTKKTNTLFLLDALISHDKPEELNLTPVEEIAEYLSPPLTLEANLHELSSAWEPFCNQMTQKLVKLLRQSSSIAYRNTLTNLSKLLSTQTGLKSVDHEHPFNASARSPESNLLDWNILKELGPVYAAYDGTPNTYPIEIGTIYSCLRRAFELGPLHIDTLQSLYRLSHVYAQELFGCYDIGFASAGFRICLLAFREHPEIPELMRIRCRTNLAAVLMANDELKAAKETLKEAIVLADACADINRGELISILRTLADCTNQIGDYDTATSVYERLRNFQEAVSRDAELFETLLHLICNYWKSGNVTQANAYQQRLVWELDWLEEANPVRETLARKAIELELNGLAETFLHGIISHTHPGDPCATRAIVSLVKIYESTGRFDMAETLKESLGS